MIRTILHAMKITFTKRKYKILFLIFFTIMLVINMLALIGIQWIINGTGPISIGFLSKPNHANINETIIMWIESNYYLDKSLNAQTFWVIYLTPKLLITMIVSGFIISLLFSELFYISKETKGKCMIEKSLGSASSITATIGIVSIASTVLSCPSCGSTIFVTLIALVAATATGSTLGLSSMIIQFSLYLLWISIVFNFALLYITSRKLIKINSTRLKKS